MGPSSGYAAGGTAVTVARRNFSKQLKHHIRGRIVSAHTGCQDVAWPMIVYSVSVMQPAGCHDVAWSMVVYSISVMPSAFGTIHTSRDVIICFVLWLWAATFD